MVSYANISAASPSPNFHSWKGYVKNITMFMYFLAICAKFLCKIEKFELEVVGVVRG